MKLLSQLSFSGAFALLVTVSHAQTLFQASFESEEGYTNSKTLAGQNGWETRGLDPEAAGITESGEMFIGGYEKSVPGNPSVSNRKVLVERPVVFDPQQSPSGVVSVKASLMFHHDNPSAGDVFYFVFADQDGFPLFSIFFLTPRTGIAFNNGLSVLEVSETTFEAGKELELAVTMDLPMISGPQRLMEIRLPPTKR